MLTEGPPDFAALNEQKTEIRIQYKDVTSGIFKDIARNELVIRVQPGEAVYLKMNAKSPGLSMKTVETEMDLTYKRRFSDLKIAEAYESLILSVLHNDHSNFVRDDELDIAWKIFTPILHYIDGQSFIRIRDLLVWVLCLIYFFWRLRDPLRHGPEQRKSQSLNHTNTDPGDRPSWTSLSRNTRDTNGASTTGLRSIKTKSEPGCSPPPLSVLLILLLLLHLISALTPHLLFLLSPTTSIRLGLRMSSRL